MLYFLLKYWYAILGAVVFAVGTIFLWIFPHPITLLVVLVLVTLILFFLYTYKHREGPWFRMPGTAAWGLPPVLLLGFLLLGNYWGRLIYILCGSICIALMLSSPKELLPTNPNQKAWRRLYMVVVTVCAFWGFAVLSTADIFFPSVWISLLALLAGAGIGLLSFIAVALWHPLHVELRRIAAVYALVASQLFVALHFLPFSALSRSVLFVWFWYIAIRLTRFALSEEGIRFKEQRVVIAAHLFFAILYIIFLRWV